MQPLIAPLYGGKSAHELLAALSDRPERVARYDIGPRASGARRDPASAPDDSNRRGGAGCTTASIARTPALSRRRPSPRRRAAGRPAAPAAGPADGGARDRRFRPDPTILDGRFANNGWLQELPKPITKLTWDNAVLVSPATAERLKAAESPALQGGEHGQIISDVVELRYRGRTVRGALFAVAGHPDDCVTVHLGYGRTRARPRRRPAPASTRTRIRTADALSFGARRRDRARPARRISLACTQYHHLMEGRGLVRAATRDEFVRDPQVGARRPGSRRRRRRRSRCIPSCKYDGYKWGMAIDLNACIGCNACVVACQAENNIPVVGKEQVLRGREMHWLRVDPYYRGAAGQPGDLLPAGAVHAVRERAVRGGLPGRRDRRTATKG